MAFWFRARLYWCEELNVPAVRPAQDKCGTYVDVPLTAPGDARPAFQRELDMVRDAIVNEFGDSKLAEVLVPNDEVVVLNKIPGYPDQADEVVVRGRILGHRFFDVEAGTWRFRPLYAAVTHMVEEGIGHYAVVALPKLARGYDIHRSDIVRSSLPVEKYRHVALATADGRWWGVGKWIRGRIRVFKSWKSREELPKPRPSNVTDAVMLNRDHMSRKAEASVRFLGEVADRYRKPLLVSYSGGKDSLVALDLAHALGRELYVLFNDTGLEPPETYENLEAVSSRYGVEIIHASAGDRFWDAIERFGPPSRDYRWCCKVIKLGPITETIKNRFPNGAISVVGQRMYESLSRARLPRISPSRWVKGVVVVAPIHDWTALEVWLYIFMKGLPYNRAYEKGFDRLGCVVCPANELAELREVSQQYPDVWSRMESALRRHVEDRAIRFGLWRWRKGIPGDLARYVKGLKNGRELPVSLTRRGDTVEMRLSMEPNRQTMLHLLSMVGKVSGEDTLRVEGRYGRVAVTGDGHRYVLAGDERAVTEAAAVIARSAICGNCDLCVQWCPTGALVRTGPDRHFAVDTDKCIHCLLCSRACPSAQYLVYRNMGDDDPHT